MRAIRALIALLCLACLAAAEKLEYLGTYFLASQSTTYKLKLALDRAHESESYAVSGRLDGGGRAYTVSGRVVAKTRKLRALLVETTTVPSGPERRLDGRLSEDGRHLFAKCSVRTPSGITADAVFDCQRVTTAEPTGLVQAYVLHDSFAQNGDKSFVVDPVEGTAKVPWAGNGKFDQSATVRFSPVPRAVALGTKWRFWLDASTIPKGVRFDFRMHAGFVDVSGSQPNVIFETGKGDRTFEKLLTWNLDSDNGAVTIQFWLDNYRSYSYFYKLKQLKKSEYDALAGPAPTTPGGSGDAVQAPGEATAGTAGSAVSGLAAGTVTGSITIRSAGGGSSDFRALTSGMQIPTGSELQCGSGATATVSLPNGGSLVLQPVSTVWFEDLPPLNGVRRVTVRVLTGTVVYQHNGRSVPVKTDLTFRVGDASIKPKGTKFTLTYDESKGTMTLNLEEGALDFEPGHDLPPMRIDAPTTVTMTVKMSG